MHQLVLVNKSYIQFAEQNTVEVIAMEEMPRALREKSKWAKTYEAKDPYGDKVEYLVHFPNLTVEQLQGLSNGKVIEYMEGPKIPYTAIVDPHSGKTMEGFYGVRRASELIASIKPHLKTLKKKYGKGADRKLWRLVDEGEVQVDTHLGDSKLSEAIGVYRHLARETMSQPDALKRRVKAILDTILDDASERLDELARVVKAGEGKKIKRELDQLARTLRNTPLEERARALLADTHKAK